jgi:non-specific serine/threonine protein kinase
MAIAQPPQTTAPRLFGRFELRQMLGRSLESSTWLAWDPRLQQDVCLCVPRVQPANPREREDWTQDVLAAARLKHPRLCEAMEVGSHDGWPFVSFARQGGQTLVERLQASPPPSPGEVAGWMADLLEGLAYAHDAGAAHLDLGLHTVLIDKSGHAMAFGLSVGLEAQPPGHASRPVRGLAARQKAERDVLMAGLLMHRLLANHPALDDPDLCSAATRVGREIVRLPWTTPHPVSETLRAIVNRATDRQHRQRYLGARTLLSALQGWIKTHSEESGGPLSLLLDRLNTVGAMPGRPSTERALMASLSAETLRVDDLVDVIVQNPALVWELLRTVNAASYRSTGSDEGVTTLSRAVLLLGQSGIRKVASAVRPWPGALAAQSSVSPESALQTQGDLAQELHKTCVAGAIARLMAPFSISDEEASVAAMSQRLGWLLMRYHFPDEAAQMQRLMQPAVPSEAGANPTPGMSAEAAAGAVLGVDLGELAVAVLRHWGLHDRLVQAAQPLPVAKPVRTPVEPEATLRTVASLANEIVDAQSLEPQKALAAMHNVYVRYARALALVPKECEQTLEQALQLIGRPERPQAEARSAAA